MNINERVHLQKLISENNTTDQTELIRQLKHSSILRNNINTLIDLKAQYIGNENMEELKMAAMVDCSFLFTYYTDIYNKIIKDEIDIKVLFSLLDALKEIEDGITDQHEASYKVGTLLKKIYVDSALRKADKLNKEHETPKEVVEGKKISWKQFKSLEKIKNTKKTIKK